jgi:hypothetical protein
MASRLQLERMDVHPFEIHQALKAGLAEDYHSWDAEVVFSEATRVFRTGISVESRNKIHALLVLGNRPDALEKWELFLPLVVAASGDSPNWETAVVPTIEETVFFLLLAYAVKPGVRVSTEVAKTVAAILGNKEHIVCVGLPTLLNLRVDVLLNRLFAPDLRLRTKGLLNTLSSAQLAASTKADPALEGAKKASRLLAFCNEQRAIMSRIT